jgi:hypothetical protein
VTGSGGVGGWRAGRGLPPAAGRDLVSVSGLWPPPRLNRKKLLNRDKFVIQSPPSPPPPSGSNKLREEIPHSNKKICTGSTNAPTTYMYLEYHSVCPLVRIGTPPPLSLARVSPPGAKGGGNTLPAGERMGGLNWDDWIKSQPICLLCGPNP